MEETTAAERNKTSATGEKIRESLLRRKYVIPFLLACVILACNQATGVNSVIGYNATILHPSRPERQTGAFWLHLLFTIVNFLTTIVAVVLVDRKGRKFLLSLGTAGVVVSMICVGLLFHKTEKLRVDVKDAMQAMVTTNQTLTLAFNEQTADQSSGRGNNVRVQQPTTVGHHLFLRRFQRGNSGARVPTTRRPGRLKFRAHDCVPANKVVAFFKNPFANLDAASNRAVEN